jgi:2-dehydropantoate 2-reductase
VWLRGMVPFNVAELAPGHWHRGTSGQLAAEAHPSLTPWLATFAAAGLPLACHDDLRPVQWAKLLLNLNNPVNALSGLALRAQLLDRDCRVVSAALQDEALALLQAARIEPARLTAVPPGRVPTVLRLPTPLFRLVAARSLRIDAQARSSMADDLAQGRPTEIDALCGEVVRLARSLGREAPLNQRMLELMSVPAPRVLGGRELRRRLGL